jgi:hypothetical protein
MLDPRQVAERIVGVDWQTEVSGFCTCPGESMHTVTWEEGLRNVVTKDTKPERLKEGTKSDTNYTNFH